MGEKYAGSEILQMAVQMEKNGKVFYDGVVRAVKDVKARDVFQLLSDEEVRHERVFRDMLDEVESKKVKSPYDDTEVILYFRSLIDRKVFPSEEEGVAMKKEVDDPAVAIRIALSLEKDSVLFYHELVQVTEGKDQEVVKRIIEEERDHIRRILQLKKELQI